MRLALVLAVWWGIPTALTTFVVRRRAGSSVVILSALVASVVAATILVIVLRSDSSTAAIGFFTLAPLIWGAPIAVLAIRRWRRVEEQ